ncbi:MAG: flagellar biosynthesis anti-sigma factor FlgM [Desulfamplus sp.]|nr:flagellar biosynthesis anti-sigma factor FlgM [Desulfamplus sp.]MBF0413011.1 flagellar biosynthesis anti-sigma factor FlgM [Desulfamplus sp.]
MRIQNPNTIFIPKSYSQPESSRLSKFATAESSVKSGKNDSVTFSDTTLQLQKISAAMDAPQDNRTDKINALKDSIARGTYSIEPEKVAEKFMNAFFI